MRRGEREKRERERPERERCTTLTVLMIRGGYHVYLANTMLSGTLWCAEREQKEAANKRGWY